jgi:hypothetical protein
MPGPGGRTVRANSSRGRLARAQSESTIGLSRRPRPQWKSETQSAGGRHRDLPAITRPPAASGRVPRPLATYL